MLLMPMLMLIPIPTQYNTTDTILPTQHNTAGSLRTWLPTGLASCISSKHQTYSQNPTSHSKHCLIRPPRPERVLQRPTLGPARASACHHVGAITWPPSHYQFQIINRRLSRSILLPYHPRLRLLFTLIVWPFGPLHAMAVITQMLEANCLADVHFIIITFLGCSAADV
jgi:hypothetical protein